MLFLLFSSPCHGSDILFLLGVIFLFMFMFRLLKLFHSCPNWFNMLFTIYSCLKEADLNHMQGGSILVAARHARRQASRPPTLTFYPIYNLHVNGSRWGWVTTWTGTSPMHSISLPTLWPPHTLVSSWVILVAFLVLLVPVVPYPPSSYCHLACQVIQIGIVLQNSLILFFARVSVGHCFISAGALFHILAALMQKLFSPIFVLALSFTSLRELGLNVLLFSLKIL